jgi:hypothetical protein
VVATLHKVTIEAASRAANTIQIDVDADDSGAQRQVALHELRAWLVSSGELGAHVELSEPAAPVDTLGTLADGLTVSVAVGGASTVLANAVLAWVRSRTGRVQVTLKRGSVVVSLDATTVARLNSDDIAGLVRQISADLDR